MSDIVIMIGGVVIVLGALSALDLGEEDSAVKRVVTKIIGGAVVVGVGLIMRAVGA